MKRLITIVMLVVGLALMVVTYFFGAAPWCNTEVACSNPRVEWSPALFVLGVIIAFSSACYYQVSKRGS